MGSVITNEKSLRMDDDYALGKHKHPHDIRMAVALDIFHHRLIINLIRILKSPG